MLSDIYKRPWIDYEGSFEIKYVDSSNVEYYVFKKTLAQRIAAAIPNEKFELKSHGIFKWGGIGGTDYSWEIICNKTLFDKYSLSPKQEWKEYKAGSIVFVETSD